MEEKLRHLDFLSSICLFLIAGYIIWESWRIHENVGGPLYASPGFLTLFLGSMLLLTSVLLFTRTVKNVGVAGNIRAVSNWFGGFIKNTDTKNMLKGIGILAIFTFFLLPRFPFLLASVIFMFFLMKVMNAGSNLKIALISSSVSICVFVLFQVIFKIPLP